MIGKNFLGIVSAAACIIGLAWLNCWVIQIPWPIYKSFSGRGRTLACIPYCNRLLEGDPKNWNLYFLRGKAYQEIGCLQMAIDDYNQAIAITGKNPEVVRQRAMAEYCITNFKKALSDFDWLIKNGGTAQDIVYKAMILNQLCNYRDASSCVDQALKLQPYSAFAYLARAEANSGLGQFSTAVSDCKVAIKLDKQSYKAAHLCLASIALKQGDWETVVTESNTVLSTQPGNSKALWLKGLGLYKLNKIQQAAECATSSICHNPMVAAPYIVHAQCMHSLHKYQDAQLDAVMAIKLAAQLHTVNTVYSVQPAEVLNYSLPKVLTLS